MIRESHLRKLEAAVVDLRIRQAMAQARTVSRAAFAQTLLAALPGTATHVWLDLDELRDDELGLLAAEGR